MSVRVDRLNRLLTVEQTSTTTQGVDGYTTPAWVERARVWCSVRHESGREVITEGGQEHEATVTIRCRWDRRLAGIEPNKWRFTNQDGTTVYDILSAHNVGLRNEMLEVLARSGSAVPA